MNLNPHPEAMNDSDARARILAHLRSVRDDAVFERTLDCIALGAGCTRQYAGRALARYIRVGLVRRERLAAESSGPSGGPHVRRGTWAYHLTSRGKRIAIVAGEEVPVPPTLGSYGRRWGGPVLAAAVKEERRGRYREAERLYRRALAEAGPAEREGWILTRLSAIQYELADYRGASALAAQAQRKLQSAGAVLRADALIARAVVCNNRFRTSEARQLLHVARRIYAKGRDVLGEAVAVHNLAYSYGNEGRVGRMLDEFEKAMKLFERAGDPEWLAFEQWTLAYHLAIHGRAREALLLAEEGLSISREIGDTLSEARALWVKGSIFHLLGEGPEAQGAHLAGLVLGLQLGNRTEIAKNLASMAKLAVGSGDEAQAAKLIDRLAVLVSQPEFRPTRRWVQIGSRREGS